MERSFDFRLKVPNRVQALRIFFSILLFSTGIEALDVHNALEPIHFILRFFSCDLLGYRGGIEDAHLYFDLSIIRTPPWSYAFFIFISVSSFALIWNRFPRVAASLALGVSQLLGYSTKGINLSFQIFSYALLGYWLGLIVGPYVLRRMKTSRFQNINTDELAWTASLNCLALVYTNAFLSKMIESGVNWANRFQVGMFLHYSQFHSQTGVVQNLPGARLIDFFSTPTVVSNILLGGALVIEGGAIFLVFLNRYSWMYIVALLALHAGMKAIIGIVWPPVVVLLIVFLIPWDWFFQNRLPSTDLRLGKIAFVITLFIATLTWTLPYESNSGKIFPLNKFGMYSFSNPSLNLYYLRSISNHEIVDGEIMRQAFRLSVQGLNMAIWHRFDRDMLDPGISQYICNLAEERGQQSLIGPLRNFEIWRRSIYFQRQKDSIVSQDNLVARCESNKQS